MPKNLVFSWNIDIYILQEVLWLIIAQVTCVHVYIALPIEMFKVIKFSRQDFFVGSNAMMKITIVRETAHPRFFKGLI